MKCNPIKLSAREIIFKTKNYHYQKVKNYQTELLYHKVKTYLSISTTQSNRKTFLSQIENKLSTENTFQTDTNQS